MRLGEVLAEQLHWTRDWTLRLIADLRGDDWSFAARPGLAHPLWICGHLAVSQDVLVFARCLGAATLDPVFAGYFPMGGAIRPVDQHAYPSPEAVVKRMAEMQVLTLDAVRGMSDEQLREPAFGKDGRPHPHYCDKLGAVTHVGRHEAFHAGQLALIRRLLGKPFLR